MVRTEGLTRRAVVQSIDHFITYSVIASNPALSYSSVVSTVRCWAVTSGQNEGSTVGANHPSWTTPETCQSALLKRAAQFVQWTGNFSSDADAGVIEDARFKRKEALAGLAAAATKGAGK